MAELYVVATPIGNLSDLSERMKWALSSCDLIAAEDTRVTMKLLNHLGIKKPLTSLHRHNEGQKADALAERMLAEDLMVCLTCDAGTPGISDPGVPLVRAAIERGIRVTPVCGPSALTAHLSACGFDARAFAFYGFLPREAKALKAALQSAWDAHLPVSVFYESPHRVLKLMETICALSGDCRVSVACDISKRYEQIVTAPALEVLEKLRANPNIEKGEYSVAVAWPDRPAAEPPREALPVEAELILAMLDGLSLQDAAERALADGRARNEVYRARLRIKDRFSLT
ncbi:MAG: 16S rRNA (cytidine(1402)-2'-O)-methyltransferase [Eubacteriales bacterium]|nr:16S rRNA (cytidine(1402)-2'-O)-methyltransferase [Christensenellaceae bacterium]MEA5066444.1 16S rRNA (cytidine(1402)-2'-O)-methyltransferase [Eubacteriales bacterium]